MNAGLHAPDGIILDLEDSVPPQDKDAALLVVRNALYALEPKADPERAAVREALEAVATLLAPFAPHAAEELWHEVLGPPARELLLGDQPWPGFDPALVAADTVTIAVQVNGKLRGEVQAAVSAAEPDLLVKKAGGLLDSQAELGIAVCAVELAVIVEVSQKRSIDQVPVIDAGLEEVGERTPR